MLLVTVFGCKASEPPKTDTPPDHTYRSRGIVEAVPSEGGDSLKIRHAAIDNFVDRSGAVVGMDSMAMSFALGPETSATGIAVGDKVAFTFEVRWDSSPTLRLTAIETLPADAPIDFRAAHPPSTSGANGSHTAH
jgi:Cu/Ag efflux protein CusF